MHITHCIILLLSLAQAFQQHLSTTRRRPWGLSAFKEGESDWFRLFQRDDDEPTTTEDDSFPLPEKYKRAKRLKERFDKLFANMPSVNEIITSSPVLNDDTTTSSSNDTPSTKRQSRKSNIDTWWFQENERQSIVDNYNEMKRQMLQQLEEQRQIDPDSVPERAHAMVESILEQEMNREIKETQELLGAQRLGEYESIQKARVEASNTTEVPRGVQRMIDKDEADYQQKQASRAEIDDFLRYEQEAVARTIKTEKDSAIPAPGSDLDQWALERLQEMAKARQDTDGQEEILDILEDNAIDLKERIAKEAQKGSVRQETVKEWQMYRSIATRLAQTETAAATSNNDYDASKEQHDRIIKSLDSWKDYIQHEEVVRKSSGLSRGPRLPFEWQEAWEENNEKSNVRVKDGKTKAQVRKDINKMSITAMEDLLEKSDPGRREKLQKELDFLKTTLESNDYLDIEVIEDDSASILTSGPVDLSDTFSLYSEADEDDDDTRGKSGNRYISSSSGGSSSRQSNYGQNDDRPVGSEAYTTDYTPSPPATPPRTPFFEEEEEETIPRVAAPKTPFFDNDNAASNEYVDMDSKLGNMDDQKLNAMFRKAGARTKESQDEIKSQWEEYKLLEKRKRDESGLSDRNSDKDAETIQPLSSKYNVSEIMKEDGDIDASKILAAIGPRPERKKRKLNTEGVNVADKSTFEEKERLESMYRSVAAVGGGRYKDDPVEKLSQQQQFEEFVNKEKEMRSALDNSSSEELDVEDAETYAASIDDKEFAEDIIASIGPRPQVKRARTIDERYLSDNSIARMVEDDDEDDEEDEDDDDDDEEDELDISNAASSQDGGDPLVPDWLRNEQRSLEQPNTRKAFLSGEEIEEAFDDDKYEHNMRQLAEYEKRRAGKQGRSVGIDISDVLSTTSDDYADYKYETKSQRQRPNALWGVESFAARKRNLLEYKELDIIEVNSLMDHKDSVHSTGVSQYTPRINKPFKEFGAIFRLEGVLVDTTGLQMKAWTRVAEKYQYKLPVLEDVRRASVVRAEIAAREVFFWTDDFIQCGHIAVAHRQYMKEVFDEWVKDEGIKVSVESDNSVSTQGSLAIGEDMLGMPLSQPPKIVKSEDEQIEDIYNAWTATAEAFGYRIDSEEDVFKSIQLSPDVAVQRTFKWTNNPLEIDEICRYYRKVLQSISKGEVAPSREAKDTARTVSKQKSSSGSVQPDRTYSKSEMMEVHYTAWTKVAEEYSFEKPLEEEVMAAFVINDPVIAIRDGFGWTDDSNLAKEAAKKFEVTVRRILHGEDSTAPPATEALSTENAVDTERESDGPSDDEVLKMISVAWGNTAHALGYTAPTLEQVKLAMDLDIDQAVMKILRWTSDPASIAEVSTVFDKELEQESQKLITKYNLKASDDLEVERTNTQVKTVTQKPAYSTDDVFKATFDAWTATAERMNFDAPDNEQVQFALTVGPEEAIVTGFEWSGRNENVTVIMDVYREEIGKRRSLWQSSADDNDKLNKSTEPEALVKFLPGAHKWIKSLVDVEMQVGVISYLERDQVAILLEQANLADVFPPERRSTGSDGYNRDMYQMLGTALRLERRPDHCVVFDASPYSSVAAHDAEMRSVVMVNPYPRYELLSADTTASSFDELTAMNIRRLFGERVYDTPQMDAQQAQPVTEKKQKTKFFWDDD